MKTKLLLVVFSTLILIISKPIAAATIFGDPKGDITIIEYLDYNCPVCRQYTPLLGYFVSQNKGIKVIQRAVPILTPESRFIDSAILASIYQNKFVQMQEKILSSSYPETIPPKDILIMAKQVGLDQTKLIKDMKSSRVQNELLENLRIYQKTGQTVIPVTVIYPTSNPQEITILSGYQPVEKLKKTIKAIRNNK